MNTARKILQRGFGSVACIATTLFVGISTEVPASQATSSPTNTAHILKTGRVEFRVYSPSDKSEKKIPKAHVILIGADGSIVKIGTTNAEGNFVATVPAQADPRFSETRPLDTTTAIVSAAGYRETVLFEVPVGRLSVQPVPIYPVTPGKRNEPISLLGNLNRHDVLGMVDKYMRLAKLPQPETKDIPSKVVSQTPHGLQA
ncbi:MAG: hypothetical protein OWQ59_01260 [Alicyclobacillaceae bacterium]|jgi:hypothetical protein|uniref:hypothetical protein n=1 Tax=Alicyclobacillus sp. SP_1 TaxID=2942475 RepID=UPI002157F3B9|nr:hypothetical protein [Alicyclobacillus sp. SP_1]MCY0887067.1 hypothetical protein [Alicyclobacillaceae bacterium]